MVIDCDILVVGCGPAGASAARAAAKAGSRVICIEKKEKIGVPVQCAEGVGAEFLPLLPFKLPSNVFEWRTSSMLFWADGLVVEKKGRAWQGYSVNRTKLEQAIAKEAKKSGAKILTSTKLVSLKRDKKFYVTEAIVKRNNKLLTIKPKKIIAADGVDSTVAKLLGLYKPDAWSLAKVYSWEMKNLKLSFPHHEQVFLGSFVPGGYAYIFPKSKTCANVGVGGMFVKNGKKAFKEFLKIPFVKQQLAKGKFYLNKSKKAVISPFLKKWLFGNVLFVGDIAGHNLKPFIEGILPAVICGDLCGNYAATATKMSAKKYAGLIKKKLGFCFEQSDYALGLLKSLHNLKDKKKITLLFLGLVTGFVLSNNWKQLSLMSNDKLKELICSREKVC